MFDENPGSPAGARNNSPAPANRTFRLRTREADGPVTPLGTRGTEFDPGLRGQNCWLELSGGERVRLPSARWRAPLDRADELVLSRCFGPSLDVGCGPGRFTAELVARGRIALGIDISAVAVAQTRQRGGTALLRDVFDPLPGEGRWRSVLLTDGNIGIGGAPRELLRRAAALSAPRARVLVELAAPGVGLFSSAVRVHGPRGSGDWFRWAWLGADAVVGVAWDAGWRTRWISELDGRWFAELDSQV